MAEFNIDNLDPVSVLNDADLFEVEQGGINKKATGAQIKAYIGSVPNDVMRWKGNWTTADQVAGGSSTKKAYFWRRTVASTTITTADGSLMPPGLLMMAVIDNPRNVSDPGWQDDWLFWYSF
jgi:hypothetical protein